SEIASVGDGAATAAEKMKTSFAPAMMAIGGAVTVAGGLLLHLGEQAEQSRVRLEQSFKNIGASFDEFKHQVEALDTSFQKYGKTHAQTEDAMGTLVTATK